MALLIARAAMAALVLSTTLARAQPEPTPPIPSPTEYEVKAAFLYNFARFVDAGGGPARSGSPFVIAILGRDPFGAILDETVAGKTVAGRPIEVRRVPRVDEARDAQIVFISPSERPNTDAILKALERPGVLTVGDTDGFAQRGGDPSPCMRARCVRDHPLRGAGGPQ